MPTQKQREVSFLFTLAPSAGVCFEFEQQCHNPESIVVLTTILVF
jgi:hypothetical protein